MRQPVSHGYVATSWGHGAPGTIPLFGNQFSGEGQDPGDPAPSRIAGFTPWPDLEAFRATVNAGHLSRSLLID
jgi:hypothetical protein